MSTSSFGYQWKRWKTLQFESKNKGKPMEGWTLRMWEEITGQKDSLQGKLIGDFGCGPGRFLEVVRMKKGMAVGIDEDEQALFIAREHFQEDPNVKLIQGSVLHAPLLSDFLDGVFSIGVLHHTNNPFQGVKEMVRALKSGGWIAVSVYKKGGYYDFPTVRLWRGFFRILHPLFGYALPLWYSRIVVFVFGPFGRAPLVGTLVRIVLPFVPLPDFEWAVHDTFDSLTPQFQSAHTPQEVCLWFERCGLVNIEQSEFAPTAWRARKP